MAWKQVYTLQKGPLSIKKRVENLVKIKSNKKGVESSVDTEGEDTERITSYTEIARVYYMIQLKGVNMP